MFVWTDRERDRDREEGAVKNVNCNVCSYVDIDQEGNRGLPSKLFVVIKSVCAVSECRPCTDDELLKVACSSDFGKSMCYM